MADFWLWITATWPKWITAVSAFGIFAIEPMARAYWPWLAKCLDRLSPTTKFRLEICIVVFAFVYAGYSSWSEEHRTRSKAESDYKIATGERDEARRQRDKNISPLIDRLSGDLLSARTEIEALKKANAQLALSIPPKYPLTDDERTRLIEVLKVAPQNERFTVELYWPQLNGTRGYADIMAAAFKEAGWDASIRMAALVNGHGLTFAIPVLATSKNPIHPQALFLMKLLSAAKIPFAIGELSNVPDGTFAFVIGQPAIAPQPR